eukprot:14624274-Ditylum_brightwellii.AAC.1
MQLSISGQSSSSQLKMDPRCCKNYCFNLGGLVIFSDMHGQPKSFKVGINKIGPTFHVVM